MGAGGPRLARPARDDDRALGLAVDAQRRGQHVGQPVGVGHAAGDAVGDALVGAVARGRGVRRPTRADGQRRQAGGRRLELGHHALGVPRTGPDEPVGRRSRAGRAAGRRPDRARWGRRSGGALATRPWPGSTWRGRPPGRRAPSGAATFARSGRPAGWRTAPPRGRGPRAGGGRPRRDRRRSRRPAPRRWPRRSRPARPSATAHAGSGRTTRPRCAGCPRRRRRAPARGWPAGRPGRPARGPRGRPAWGRRAPAAARWCRGRRR